MAEAHGLGPCQCGFESHRPYFERSSLKTRSACRVPPDIARGFFELTGPPPMMVEQVEAVRFGASGGRGPPVLLEDVGAVGVEPAMVEPVDPFSGGQSDLATPSNSAKWRSRGNGLSGNSPKTLGGVSVHTLCRSTPCTQALRHAATRSVGKIVSCHRSGIRERSADPTAKSVQDRRVAVGPWRRGVVGR